MEHPKISNEEMLSRVARFEDIKDKGVALMFIDSILPSHQRLNFSIIGDTASENPTYEPAITQPHKFQIGMCMALPGCGPAYHTHDYVYWGNDPDGEPDGEVNLGVWDMISFPPGLWRGFENIGDEPAWFFAVLDPHTVFEGKDPYWAESVVKEAEAYGFYADESGKMIKPDNYDELEKEMRAKLEAAL